MLLETSNTTSNFANKPHIKKGYYPGKLLSVKVFSGRDNVAKVCKHGKQLILDFEVWKEDKSGPVLVEEKPVVISKFVYHIYKVTDKDGVWDEKSFKTAITPNSKITEILEALGWKFTEEPVDPESFVGNFAELNINDYTNNKGKDNEQTYSSIGDIGELPESGESDKPELTQEIQEQIDKLEESRKNLDKLKESEDITEQGYTDAIEQIDHDIKKLKG